MGKTFPALCKEVVADAILEQVGGRDSPPLPGPRCNSEGQHLRHDNEVKAEMHWGDTNAEP